MGEGPYLNSDVVLFNFTSEGLGEEVDISLRTRIDSIQRITYILRLTRNGHTNRSDTSSRTDTDDGSLLSLDLDHELNEGVAYHSRKDNTGHHGGDGNIQLDELLASLLRELIQVHSVIVADTDVVDLI